MKVHLQENDPSYKIFLYVFYVSAFIMCSITIFGFYAMIQEWSAKGTYVMGEVLVKTEFPTPHFAKLITWLFFSSIVSWYCVSRISLEKDSYCFKMEAYNGTTNALGISNSHTL